MESSLDPHDELRRLQDKVRKLELQNEQLRSQQFSRNGFELEIKPNILSSFSDLEYYKNRLDQSNHNWDDEFLKPEELSWENFQNEEIWLCKPVNDTNLPVNSRRWLHQDVDNQTDYELQNIRRKLVDKIDEIEQGSRKNFIDTRTFTRPKKRITRPGLDVMSERPILENRQLLETPWKRLMSKQITEMIDDVSMNYDFTLPSLSSPSFNATFHKEETNLNSTFRKVASETKSVITPQSPMNTTFVKVDEETRSSDSDRSSNSRKTSDSCLNATFVKGSNSPLSSQTMNRTRHIGLNCTFSTNTDNNRSGRTASCESGADDDQLSSASDSSFSSTTRLMNVGDVQTIARLQEESLKLVTSTPKRNISRDGIVLMRGEDNFSPVKQITPEVHQGYLSDNSDHSSVEGLARSSRSSVRSSPCSSPFGSTVALANECPQIPTALVQRRELKGVPPRAVKSEMQKPETGTKLAGGGQRRVVSGLRPPAVRPGSTSRPPAVGGSNIPRPASRIPAPRVRSTYTSQQTAPKTDWMDGCY